MTNRIARIALPVPLRKGFDYKLPMPIANMPPPPGTRVLVSFCKQRRVGILLGYVTTSPVPDQQIKTLIDTLDDQPLLSARDLRLLQWASDYYHHPIGEVVFSALPTRLRRPGRTLSARGQRYWKATEDALVLDPGKLTRAPRQAQLLALLQSNRTGIAYDILRQEHGFRRPVLLQAMKNGWVHEYYTDGTVLNQPPAPAIALNVAQRQAVAGIMAAAHDFAAILLNGVTGSGKTEVYLEAARQILLQQRQVLILVPEIGLIPQLVERIAQRLGIHASTFSSGLADSDRMHTWMEARAGRARIIVGTRSAVWIPLASPGLLVVDEEHDPSYKQQDGFRYSARDIAVMRGKHLGIPVVLGSATPSLESLQNVKTDRFAEFQLLKRAGNIPTPEFQILDIRSRRMHGAFSDVLLDAIRAELAKGNQILVFLNRRGYSPVMMCHDCGWVVTCDRCDTAFTYHKHADALLCHHCGRRTRMIEQCTKCHSSSLIHIGHGTERLSEMLAVVFPDATIIRVDSDTTRRRGAIDEIRDTVLAGGAQILIGTQMLTKGHHFPQLTLVAVIDADRGFFTIDFRASERMAQLFVQISGRAGRESPGKIIIQTHYPEHAILQKLVSCNYSEFSTALLQERQQSMLPPFGFLALLRAEHFQSAAVMRFLQEVRALLQPYESKVSVMGPVPAPMERRAGRWRYQLLVQGVKRDDLHYVLRCCLPAIESSPRARRVRWSLDVDPQHMY